MNKDRIKILPKTIDNEYNGKKRTAGTAGVV